MPAYSETSGYGFGVEVPYYWAIAPDYDVTFSPRITSKQGVLFQAEFRQRLMDGSYQIRAYGIDQLDPGLGHARSDERVAAAAGRVGGLRHRGLPGRSRGRRAPAVRPGK